MRESVRILRFAIVGTLNALITALIVGLLMHIEGEHYMIANVVAYVVAQIHNLYGVNSGFSLLMPIGKRIPSGMKSCFLPVLLR